MIRWRKRIRRLTYLFADGVSILIAFQVAMNLYTDLLGRKFYFSPLEVFALIVMLGFAYIGAPLAVNLYDESMIEERFITLRVQVKTVLSITVAILLVTSLLFILHMPLPRLFLLFFTLVYYVLYIINKIILLKLVHGNQNHSKADRQILIVGCNGKGRRYINEIHKHKYLSFNIPGYVCVGDEEGYDGLDCLGSIDDLPRLARKYQIDEIAVSKPLGCHPSLKVMLDECQGMGITITMLLETYNESKTKAHVAMVGSVAVLKFHTVSLNESQIFAKRILDLIGASAGMLLFGMAFLVLGPLIKLETPGPIIFKQIRVGKNGREFEIWKFRSMGVNAEAQKATLMACNEMGGHMFKMTNDPRVTRIGAFIRKTSLDELPQFYNVLKGDMSLVGTRPPTINEVKAYEQHHHKRISINPGITGMWQISGRSDITDFEEVVKLDSEYIAKWTLWSDVKILVKTVEVVLGRRGSK